jgi:hypothetical protein
MINVLHRAPCTGRRALLSLALVAGLVVGLGSMSVAAETAAVVSKSASQLYDFSDCVGEPVTGSGTMYSLSQSTDKRYQQRITGHFDATDSSGNKYEANVKFSFITDAPTFQFVDHTVLVSKGAAPNEYFLLTLGIDKDGVFYFTVTTDCHG